MRRAIQPFRGAVLRESGKPLEIVQLVAPTLDTGQVLVRLNYSGVCRSQLMEVRGLRGPDPWLPHLLGHEGVGVVVDIGDGVRKVEPGDLVIVGWIRGDGIEADAATYTTVDGEHINGGRVTSFSEYAIVSENRVYLKPHGIDERSAVLFGCALLTGAGMILNEAQPQEGETLLISGLGGVGLSSLIATRGLGTTVIAVDPDEAKRNIALRLGALCAFDPNDGELGDHVRSVCPEGVDVAIDATGTVTGIESAFSCLRDFGGRLIFASHPPSGQRIRLDPLDLIRGRTIRGSWGGSSRPDHDIPRLADAILEAGAKLDFMTPRTYSLDEVNMALDDLEARRTMRPILEVKDSK